MKKKYLSILLLALVLIAVIFTSYQSMKVVKGIIASNEAKKSEGQIIIVLDPGHPRTFLG